MKSLFTATLVGCLSICLFQPAFADPVQFQGGFISLPATANNSTTFQTVTFANTFATVPVVVAGPIGIGGPAPAHYRIRNVTTSGFEIVQLEPPGEDGQHAVEDISWLALEQTGSGYVELSSGVRLQAGTLNTTNTVQGTGGPNGFPNTGTGFGSQQFANSYVGTPVVLAAIQTMNNESATDPPPGGPSSPFLATAIRNVDGNGFEVALERGEANDGGTVTNPETIGYISVTQGFNSFIDANTNQILFDAFLSEDEIVGFDDAHVTVNFNQTFAGSPNIVGNLVTRDGGDGGWLRYDTISNTEISLFVEEDLFSDDERSHTNEIAGLFAFDQAFNVELQTVPEPTSMTLLGISSLLGMAFYRRKRNLKAAR